jgi:chemotaxis protein MotB
LFASGRSEPSAVLHELLKVVAPSFAKFENAVKIVGHTDDRQYRDGAHQDNWSLSADRANAARRLLIAQGLDGSRVREVSGRADTAPLVDAAPSAAQNRRISITILTD